MEYLVRTAALEGFSEQVRELGGDPERLFAAFNITRETRADPENLISYRVFLELLDGAVHHTGNEQFGLLLSGRQSLRMFGAIGLLIQESSNVRTALQDFIRFFHLYNQGATVELKEHSDLAVMKFTIQQPGSCGTRQQEDLAMGICVNLMRMLCGKNWSPRSKNFMHSVPSHLRLYQQHFRCPLAFDQESTCTVFDASELDKPVAGANAHLHSVLLEHLGAKADHMPRDFGQRIKRMITHALSAGDCSIDRVAGSLAINKRTLQRQLKQQGLSFKALLDEARFDMAMRYLRESRLSLTQIAEIVCYNDLSAFSSAFKRRSGMSPAQWRKAHPQLAS